MLLSEEGHEHAEAILADAGLLAAGSSLYDAHNISLMHHLYAALRAHSLYHRDQHYVVQNGEVIIVDEFTGRLMTGRRWSEGLHQAVEAKEGVAIQRENQTLASITFQNYFRMYGKLAGMTGTADTEAFEFQQIYHLETVVIPTHLPMVRKDENDLVFRTLQEKVDAIIADVKDCHERGQPVLVGTTSIENSEMLSGHLEKAGLKHEVLNAKQHAREAEIVAQAGRPNAITIATNMAGRGTDIVLGGAIEPTILKMRDDASIADDERERTIATMRSEWQERHDAVVEVRRPAHRRHRAPRVAAHRQPAARPLRPPGRPGQLALLPVARGPAAEDLRRRAPRRHHAEAQDARGRADRARDRQPQPREGAAPRRVAQLRHPQGAARVRRRRERPAPRHLPAAQRPASTRPTSPRRSRNMIRGEMDAAVRRHVPAESVEEQWDLPALETALAGDMQLRVDAREWVKDPEVERRDDPRPRRRGGARGVEGARGGGRRARSCARSSAA